MPIVASLAKLDPRTQLRNPVMFAVYLGSILTTLLWMRSLSAGTGESSGFILGVALWLWSPCCSPTSPRPSPRGTARPRPASLRKSRTQVDGPTQLTDQKTRQTTDVPATELQVGDLVLVRAGDVIPADGEVVEGVASVDESAITGESAPVVRESGGDRSAVTGGTRVISDWLVVRVATLPGQSFLDRMIAMVEGAKRQKTPNEIALAILLGGPDAHLPAGGASRSCRSRRTASQASGQGQPVSLTVLVALLRVPGPDDNRCACCRPSASPG